MRIKMAKGIKAWRLEELNRYNWETMEIKGDWLILRKQNDSRIDYILIKKYPKMISKFNYDFVRRLIENADQDEGSR